MAAEIKLHETRGRLTHVRGEIAICSALKRIPAEKLSTQLLSLLWEKRDSFDGRNASVRELLNNLPYGNVLSVTDIEDCMPTSWVRSSVSPIERICGDYSNGRFVWMTDDFGRRRLKDPVPVKGGQRFFFLPPDVEQKVRAQL